MMTALREKTALILWFVIFAFVGLIVVEWGADYTGGQGPQAVGDDVGVVNGEAVSLKDFQGALRQAAGQMPEEISAPMRAYGSSGMGFLCARSFADAGNRTSGRAGNRQGNCLLHAHAAAAGGAVSGSISDGRAV